MQKSKTRDGNMTSSRWAWAEQTIEGELEEFAFYEVFRGQEEP
jgi:hypothetical protein